MSECQFPDDPHCGGKRAYRRGCRHEDCIAAESRYRHERYLLGQIEDPMIPKRRLKLQPIDWMRQGKCVDRLDIEWVPDNAKVKEFPSSTKRMAREFCGECSVREKCLQYGIATKSQGIWGGTYLAWEPRKRAVNLLA